MKPSWKSLLGLLIGLGLAACSRPVSAPPHWVLVSQAGSSTVAVVDPEAGTVVKRLTVGLLPHRLLVSPDRASVYVVLVGSQAVAELDLTTLSLRRTFLTAAVPLRREDGSVIQAHQDQDAFSHTTCYDCHGGGSAKPAIVGTRPFGITLSPDGLKLIVSQIRGGDLVVLDREKGSLERTLPLEPTGSAHEAADVALMNGSFYVALRPTPPATTPAVIRRLDAKTLEFQSEAPTGSDPAMLLPDPERSRVLVSNFETNTLSAFDASGRTLTYTVTPGPLGMLKLPGDRLLSLNYYSNAVSLVDLKRGAVESVGLEFGGRKYVNPTHAALSPDGKLAYIVSSGTGGNLLVFDLGQKRVVRVIPIDGLSYDVVTVPR